MKKHSKFGHLSLKELTELTKMVKKHGPGPMIVDLEAEQKYRKKGFLKKLFCF